jgi:hypothetical protein
MRYFFRGVPLPIERMLVVESGSRQVLEGGLPRFRAVFGDPVKIDLVTCLPGAPAAVDPATTEVLPVSRYRTAGERWKLLRELRGRRYQAIGVVCSDEPVMTWWKAAVALLVPGKVVAFNENSDFFWIDWRHRKTLRHFVLFRMGMLEEGAVRKLVQAATFPVILAYLVLYAGWAHLRRLGRLTGGR